MYNKIRLWWKFEGKYYHKDFIRGIKNLWKWFPVVWKDKDWDQEHIYNILQFKIEQQAYAMSARDIHTTAQRNAEIMLLCARLIQIQKEDLYGLEHLDYYEEKHKFIPTDETRKWNAVESTIVRDDLDEYFLKYPKQFNRVIYGKIKIGESIANIEDRKSIAMFMAHDNQERSRKLLFKIMEENIERWWD
jgi:hypothetical protein